MVVAVSVNGAALVGAGKTVTEAHAKCVKEPDCAMKKPRPGIPVMGLAKSRRYKSCAFG